MKYLFTILVSLLILVAVIIPGSNLPSVDFVGIDKIVHIGLFGLWAFAVCYDFRSGNFNYFLIFFIGVFFSFSTEVLQVFVEGRTFDWYDLIADYMGSILGLSVSKPLLKWLKRANFIQ